MTTPLLQIKGVSKFYKDKVALNKVSIDVPKGCIYGLLGPNGAGKTSLIRIINQITMPDEGSIVLDGQTLSPSHIRNIGYLPEERGLYKKVDVLKQLIYFARLRGLTYAEARERAIYWLKKMELYDVRNKKTQELSKGMQQKVQFIVAVINSPELLILDEPFSGFDPVNAELLTSVILDLKQAGTTIIFSTHRMENVEQLCDYMALINLSEKILDGKVSDIRQQFRTDTFELLVESPVRFDGSTITSLSEKTDEWGYYAYTIRLNGISHNDALGQIMQQAQVTGFRLITPSIHDIFIQLVTQNTSAAK